VSRIAAPSAPKRGPALDVSRHPGRLARAAAAPGRNIPGRCSALLAFSNLRYRSTASRAFSTEAGTAMWGHPCTQSSRNRSSVSVSVKKPYRDGFSARPKPYAARKSSAWPDEGEASEDQLPQQRAVKTFSQWIQNEPKEKWSLLFDKGGVRLKDRYGEPERGGVNGSR
jgi:hypothetical protein